MFCQVPPDYLLTCYGLIQSLTISESRQIKVLKLLARMGIKLGKENERESTLAIKIACKMNAEYNEELYF